jgi:hypothetical protein
LTGDQTENADGDGKVSGVSVTDPLG